MYKAATEMQTRRTFTKERKIELLDQAARKGASIAGIAKANQLSPSLLFTWRKQMRLGNTISTVATTEVLDDAQQGHFEILQGIQHFEQQLAPLIIEKLTRDVRTDAISAYNSSTAFASLVGSFCKLATLKMQVVDKLAAVEPAHSETPMSPEEIEKQRKIADYAEQMLVGMSKNKDMYLCEQPQPALTS